jgi:hypothetical protein
LVFKFTGKFQVVQVIFTVLVKVTGPTVALRHVDTEAPGLEVIIMMIMITSSESLRLAA